MLIFKDLINERLSQKISVLYPVVLTVHSILAAVNRIDLSGAHCTSSITFSSGKFNPKFSKIKY